MNRTLIVIHVAAVAYIQDFCHIYCVSINQSIFV